MKIGEIIRKIADITDMAASETGAEVDQMPAVEPETQINPQLTDIDVDNTDHTCDDTMVPPLQQKHELLKKATDVENNTETFADDNDEADVNDLKKLAGLGEPDEAIIQVASDNIYDVD